MTTPDKIHPSQITEWIRHPVTQEFLQKIDQHLKGNMETLNGIILNNNSQQIETSIPLLIQLKGQIHTFELIYNLKEFLSELTEEVIPNEL